MSQIKVQSINRIPSMKMDRSPTGMGGMDDLLGGGFVPGEVVIMAGEPGAGKSTLLLQLANGMGQLGKKILYVCGEENMPQVRLRADRLGTLNQNVICTETVNLEDIKTIDEEINADLIIVDSLQMLRTISKKAMPGTPTQMKFCLDDLTRYVQDKKKILVAIGHANKSGMVAGLLTLQHMVDAVLFMSKDEQGGRYIEAKKNRFGGNAEGLGLMMTASGLHEVNEDGRIIVDIGVAPSLVAPREVLIDHKKISKAIANGSWFNKHALRLDMKWIYKAVTGQELTDNVEYDIVYRVNE